MVKRVAVAMGTVLAVWTAVIVLWALNMERDLAGSGEESWGLAIGLAVWIAGAVVWAIAAGVLALVYVEGRTAQPVGAPPPATASPAQPVTGEVVEHPYSWRNPGPWRLGYALVWVALAVVLFVGALMVGSLGVAAVAAPIALLPAVGGLLAVGKVRLFLVTALGFLVAFVELLAIAAIHPPAAVAQSLIAMVAAAFGVSAVAMVILLVRSHETRYAGSAGPDISIPDLPDLPDLPL